MRMNDISSDDMRLELCQFSANPAYIQYDEEGTMSDDDAYDTLLVP